MIVSLNKYIALCGICSRRKADILISDGKILVNGKLPGNEKYIDTDKDIVTYGGKNIKPEEKKIYIMLNKPVGYLSSVTDDRGRRTILDLININERVYPVGRLDYNSSGLIILTNNGDFANKVSHPRYHLDKEYTVSVDKRIDDRTLNILATGVVLNGEKTLPAKVHRINDKQFSIVLYEGRNRQIRRMCESVGFNVIYLKRIRIGKLRIGKLLMGKWKHFNPDSIF